MTKLEEYEKQIKYHSNELKKHDRALKELFVLRNIEEEKLRGQITLKGL